MEDKKFLKEKREWKKKNAKAWSIDLKFDDYEEIENVRRETGLARPAFLKMLVENYKTLKSND